MTALLEYLDLLQCLKITVLGHVHLSACNINNSPHKLGFQFSMRAGDQKLRFDLVWPYGIPAKVGTEMRLYTPLLCAKFQGNRIARLSFIAVFVSVRQEKEKEEEKKKRRNSANF